MTIAAPPDLAPQQPVRPAKPFRIVFTAYDGEPKKPKEMSFHINTVDNRQPPAFLKIGETVPNTHLQILKFEQKLKYYPNSEEADFSELTVINTQTQKLTVLILGRLHILP